MFKKECLSDSLKLSMIEKGVWSDTCPIPLERLNILHLSYYNFDGKIKKDGKMVVLDIISENVINIFNELFLMKFPISTILPIDKFNGSDEASMEANNTSCFNYRKISNKDLLSIHSYGLAIDLNPKQNPYYLNNDIIKPKTDIKYLLRENIEKGMIDLKVSKIFFKNGFSIWGGNWEKEYKDYHHFQLPENIAQILSKINIKSGKMLLKCCIYKQKVIKNIEKKDIKKILSLYESSEENFINTCKEIISGKIKNFS